jgi:hypothetical protein
MANWRAYALAAPAALLGVALLACLGLAVVDQHPFWRAESLTLSEAAALRDAGEVARQLRGGADPLRTYRVRAGVLGPDALELTPLALILLILLLLIIPKTSEP